MRIFNKKVVVVVAALALVGIGGGTALAYWTSTGSGAGSATTGTSTAWTVTSDGATGGALTPGGPTDTVAVHVKNDATTGVQHLNAVSVIVGTDATGAWANAPTGCSALDFAVPPAVTITAGDVAAGATVNGTATITMNNLTTNQDACQGVTVPLFFVAS